MTQRKHLVDSMKIWDKVSILMYACWSDETEKELRDELVKLFPSKTKQIDTLIERAGDVSNLRDEEGSQSVGGEKVYDRFERLFQTTAKPKQKFKKEDVLKSFTKGVWGLLSGGDGGFNFKKGLSFEMHRISRKQLVVLLDDNGEIIKKYEIQLKEIR